ncbi:hypothetical protein PTE_00202 [Photorhabdus khanii NC19]|uniref:Uncharacterized protein n=1 Tax=Photorhabdus khanii NC19 TaxID=1004151 RepID=W3VB93_9GAMM|nr:hypothetical protein PTE_00202 [Photorhabdus khanii NC19]
MEVSFFIATFKIVTMLFMTVVNGANDHSIQGR